MFDIFLDSAMYVTKLMRFRTVVQPTGETAKIYSLITDNYPLLMKLDQDCRRVNLDLEMNWFIANRVAFTIKTITKHIITFFDLKNHSMDESRYEFKIGNNRYQSYDLMNIQTIQLLEFDIDQAIKISTHTSKMENHDVEHFGLSTDTVFDLEGILKIIISNMNYDQPAQMVQSTKYKFPNLSDSESINCLIILAYLMVKVAFALFLTNTKFDSAVVKSAKFKMMHNEFENVLSFGSTSLSNIICCFNNFNFMKYCIENKEGSYPQELRSFLLNLMTISRITEKRYM